MAQLLKFNPKPTFKLTVSVTVPGEEQPGELTLTVKHMKPVVWQALHKEASDWIAANTEPTTEGLTAMQAEIMLKLVTGWAWDKVELNHENMVATLENYPTFYPAVMAAYGAELWAVRAKS